MRGVKFKKAFIVGRSILRLDQPEVEKDIGSIRLKPEVAPGYGELRSMDGGKYLRRR